MFLMSKYDTCDSCDTILEKTKLYELQGDVYFGNKLVLPEGVYCSSCFSRGYNKHVYELSNIHKEEA
jgi:hypothetical protein